MGTLKRKPLQGVWQIIRFNWHYYALAIVLTGLALFLIPMLSRAPATLTLLICLLAFGSLLASLAVSWYVYDHSSLYSLSWLDIPTDRAPRTIANIHAGFDETSFLIRDKFPEASLIVLDFYDPLKHTEISIERARKAYAPFPGTRKTRTDAISLPDNSMNLILLVLSAHEIRQTGERIQFFTQLKAALLPDGNIIVVEHQRDLNNFMAYSIGAFHFFSNRVWKQTFERAGLYLASEKKLTPFLSIFILKKNVPAS